MDMFPFAHVDISLGCAELLMSGIQLEDMFNFTR